MMDKYNKKINNQLKNITDKWVTERIIEQSKTYNDEMKKDSAGAAGDPDKWARLLAETTYKNIQKARKAYKEKNYKEAAWRTGLALLEADLAGTTSYEKVYKTIFPKQH